MGEHRKQQAGQILLITLLVLSIATTVVLSVIGRSTTDISITNQIDESSKAFSAAEAGIEQVLKSGITTSGNLGTGINYSAVRTDLGGGAQFVVPQKTPLGGVATIWMVGRNADGSLNEGDKYGGTSVDVCWSSESTTPAVIVGILYKSGSEYRLAKGAYDPNPGARPPPNNSNNFITPITATTGGCGVTSGTTYRQTISWGDFGITASDTVIALRIQPVYSSTQIALNAPSPLKAQGNKIESVGKLDSGVTRKIIANQSYPGALSIFDHVIHSQGSFCRGSC